MTVACDHGSTGVTDVLLGRLPYGKSWLDPQPLAGGHEEMIVPGLPRDFSFSKSVSAAPAAVDGRILFTPDAADATYD